MSKLNKCLMVTIAITLIFSAIALVGLGAMVETLNHKVDNKDLQLSILWQETNSLQKINAEMNNKNSELRGYTNFLESQNKMLMERDVSE